MAFLYFFHPASLTPCPENSQDIVSAFAETLTTADLSFGFVGQPPLASRALEGK